jgi:hypothetical protein
VDNLWLTLIFGTTTGNRQIWDWSVETKLSPPTGREKGMPFVSSRKKLVPTSKRVGTKHAQPPSLFGPPPLIEGEEESTYDEFLARTSSAVKPKDLIEEIWVRDIVDLSWEALRLRRIKASLLKSVLSKESYDYDKIDTVERIDRMVMSAERRRNDALREIERHRTSIAGALRRATEESIAWS